jgi:hypothetical protein
MGRSGDYVFAPSLYLALVHGDTRHTRSGREGQEDMVKLSVEVQNGTARFRVGVRAERPSAALSVVRGRHPSGEMRLVYTAEPEGLFGGEPTAVAVMAGAGHTRQKTA